MFLMIAVTTKEEPISYNHVKDCKYCDDRGSFNVFLTYNVFTLFFIPIWRWNFTYFVETTCCNRRFILDKTIGDMLKNGDDIEIEWNDLREINYDNM